VEKQRENYDQAKFAVVFATKAGSRAETFYFSFPWRARERVE
jgi:hypothetical protein